MTTMSLHAKGFFNTFSHCPITCPQTLPTYTNGFIVGIKTKNGAKLILNSCFI